MGILSSFLKFFKIKPSFNGTPEMFLALVMELQAKNSKEYSAEEVRQWGEVMQKVLKVNLSPYKDFEDLQIRGNPDRKMVSKMWEKADELHQRIELKKAIYGEKADLGEDDIVKSNSDSAVFARGLITDLSNYIEFKKDDQELIDKIRERSGGK